jgi:hypothetical protein
VSLDEGHSLHFLTRRLSRFKEKTSLVLRFGFVSGHDFSRAAIAQNDLGFSPWYFLTRPEKAQGLLKPDFFGLLRHDSSRALIQSQTL